MPKIDYNHFKALREARGWSQSELADRSGYVLRTIRRWEKGEGVIRQAVYELLLSERVPGSVSPPGNDFTFIDLFAGIGGLRKGFTAAGGNCVFTSEWDKYAQQTYRANFGQHEVIAGDIVQLPSEFVPSHDVLLAGFPCQPFSIAGVSKKNSLGRAHGFACETQGTLFFEVARILEHHRPAAFVLENVKNLKTHDGGRTFDIIMKTLKEELGYPVVEERIIDARSFVPQHRERIIIVGFREKNAFSLDDLVIPDRAHGPRLRSILHPEDGTEPPEERYTDARGKVHKRYRLSEHLWQYLQDYADKHKAKGNGFGYGLVGPDDVARTLSARYYKDGSEILVKRSRGTPRRLTPRECARLMGFDQPGQQPMEIPVSDTQAYKQFGNSVAVPVIEAVAQHMRPYILGETAPQLTLPLRAKIA